MTTALTVWRLMSRYSKAYRVLVYDYSVNRVATYVQIQQGLQSPFL